MTSDQVVHARDVLRSVMIVRRQGSGLQLERLQQIEPDLAEFLMEELSAIYQMVLSLGGKPKVERRIVLRIEAMAVVLVTSLREAHLRLWQDQSADTRLTQIDPSLSNESPVDPIPPQGEAPNTTG